jgi:polyisoprenoid-binding protein YceI
MKKIILAIFVSMIGGLAGAQELIPADNGSTIKFRVKNFGLGVTGTFTGLQGSIVFNTANLPASSFQVSVDANSIETGIDLRNNHLRKEAYFDVKNHPRISFVSTGVSSTAQSGILHLAGKLTIRGITKDIGFPFTAAVIEQGYLFTGSFTINRHDFNVGGNNTIADSVRITLQVAAKKK